jgi:hypothetical protein
MDEVEKCKRPKSSLYEDMKDGILTKEEYLELHEAYLKKEKEGEEKMALYSDYKDEKISMSPICLHPKSLNFLAIMSNHNTI